MIYPVCHHTLPTKTQLGAAAPRATGWIFTCREDYEQAIRASMVHYADTKTAVELEEKLVQAREKLHRALDDLEDMRLLCKQGFVRCAGCHRLKEISKHCRWCHP